MRTALIVGAGIGGRAAGIALRRAGWRARVFERAAAPRELGFALNLAPNAVVALRALGVADRVEAEGHRMRVGELRRMNGQMLKRLDIGAVAPGTPSLIALRQTVHGTSGRAASGPRRWSGAAAASPLRSRWTAHWSTGCVQPQFGRRRRACCCTRSASEAGRSSLH